MKSETKSHILQVAGRLFFHEGLTTGVDRITSECSTAKMTIYHHFASKEKLICEVLRESQTALFSNIQCYNQHSVLPAREQLEATFNIVCFAMNDPEIRAGLAVRAALEFPSATHPVHQAALQFDRAIIQRFASLCAACDFSGSDELSRQLLLLTKGCFIMSPVVGIAGSRILATSVFRQLLAPLQMEAIQQ